MQKGETITEEMLIEMYSKLSERGLAEEKSDTFIQCLLEREPYAMDLINHRVELPEKLARDFLAREQRIIEKLKEERARVLEEMEQLSKTRKATTQYIYSSSCPLTPGPIYFDKKG